MAAKILSVSFELNNSTGNQDITISGIGGETVKAARIIACCATSQDATIAELMMSMGFTDGTDQRCVAGQDKDNVNPANNGRCQVDDALIQFYNSASAAIVCKASFVSFITNGIRINVDTAYGSKVRCILQLYAGADISADVGWFTPHATQNSAVDITTGFRPDLIYFMDGSATDSGTSEWAYLDSKFGVAARSGGQGFVKAVANDNVSPTACGMVVSNTKISVIGSYTLEVTAYASTTFSVTTRDAAGSSNNVCYLALKFTYGNAMVVAIDSPTATGSKAYTGAGFTPKHLEIIGCMNTAYNTTPFDGIGIFHYVKDSNAENTLWYGSEDNVNPSDTYVRQQAGSLYHLDHTATLKHQATFTSFDTDGATLNFTTADGTARKWLAVFINEDVSGTPFVPSSWGRKCKLTIDHTKVYEDVTDFPVCLTKDNVPSEMIDLDGTNRCNTNGSDIRITTDAAGTTECPIEIVVCSLDNNPANSLFEAHTKLPSISSSVDTDFYIWYKNASATAYANAETYGRNNVWNSNYVYVSHCQSTVCVDSTGIHSAGTPRDSVATGAGIVQNGLNHATYNKYTSIPDNSESRIGNLWTASHGFALEAWAKTASDFDPDSVDSSPKRHVLISKGMNWNTNYKQNYAFGFWETDDLGIEIRASSTWATLRPNSSVAGSWAASTQYYLAFRITKLGSGNRKFTWVIRQPSGFRAETEQTYGYDNDAPSGTEDTVNIGAHRENQLGNYMNWTDAGVIIDEARISKFERSVNWLKTTYETIGAPSTFITEGTPEPVGSVSIGLMAFAGVMQ